MALALASPASRARRGSRLISLLLVLALLGLVVAGGSSCARVGPGDLAERGELAVYFIDVGQGDGAMIRTPGGKVMVIDTGVEATTVASFLKKKGVTKVDILVTTHPHADHIGGAVQILSRFPVTEVYDSGQVNPTPQYKAFLEKVKELVDKKQTKFHKARAGDKIALDPSIEVTVLSPVDPLPTPDEDQSYINDSSIVVRVLYKKVSFLFAADAEQRAERGMLGRHAELRSTVLKVGHHGSHSSTSMPFARAVAPEVAVISAGKNNPYGHPQRQSLQNLMAVGVKPDSIYVTAERGTVTVVTDGSTYRVETEKKPK